MAAFCRRSVAARALDVLLDETQVGEVGEAEGSLAELQFPFWRAPFPQLDVSVHKGRVRAALVPVGGDV